MLTWLILLHGQKSCANSVSNIRGQYAFGGEG